MINAAVEIIAHSGILNLRLTEVGLRAGYSRGLAAMRFKTKASLLSHVAKYLHSRWLETLRLRVRGETGFSALFAAIDAQHEWMVSCPSEMRAMYLIAFHSFDPSAEYHFHVEKMLDAQRDDMASWLTDARNSGEGRSDLDADDEAAHILAAMVGIVYQNFIDQSIDVARMHAKLKSDIARRLSSGIRVAEQQLNQVAHQR